MGKLTGAERVAVTSRRLFSVSVVVRESLRRMRRRSEASWPRHVRGRGEDLEQERRRVPCRRRAIAMRRGPERGGSCGHRGRTATWVRQGATLKRRLVARGTDADVDARQLEHQGAPVLGGRRLLTTIAGEGDRRRCESLTCDLEAGRGVAGGMEAVVTDLDEARRQYVLEEAGEERLSGKADALAVLGPEGDVRLVHGDEASVGEAYSVRVSAEVADHLLGTAERSLRIHDPGRLSEGTEVDAPEVDVPAGMRAFQGGEHLSAEEGTHDANGEEEVAS